LSNKGMCVEIDIYLFIHCNGTQRDVTRKKCL